MYRFKESKNNIREYMVINNSLFYKKKENNYHLYLDNLLIDEENHGFFSFNNYYGLNHEATTDLVDFFSGIKTTIPTIFLGTGFYDNNFIISKNSIREDVGLYSSNYVICQLFPFKELYELPYRYYGSGYRFGNSSIRPDKTKLSSLSLLTGEYEWEINIIEGKILSLLGIHADTLIICLQQSGRDFSLLGIDIHTGKKTWHNDQNSLLNGENLQFLQDKVFSVSSVRDNSYFIEIDLVTQKPLRYGDLESLKKNGIGGIFRFLIQDNHIYFTAKTVYESVESILGVMDYDTLEVLWWQKLDLPPFVILSQTPQVSENKLYVLDTAWVLHIFEREE